MWRPNLFYFSGLMKLCMSTNQTISSPFTKASVECDAQISNCTHFPYKSWVIPSCLCSKRLVSNVKNFCESLLLWFEPVHTPHQYFLKKGECMLHTYMINHASNKIRTQNKNICDTSERFFIYPASLVYTVAIKLLFIFWEMLFL